MSTPEDKLEPDASPAAAPEPAPAPAAPAPAGNGEDKTASFAWPDGWRDQMVAEMEDAKKERKLAERYENPAQVWKKAREFERRLSKGELRSVLPENATPEDVARWRKENALPEKAEDFRITMPEGHEPPKEDDAFLGAVRNIAFEKGYSQDQLDGMVGAFYAEVERQATLEAEQTREAERAAEDALRRMWGEDYRVNRNLAESLLSRAPESVREGLLESFLPDGTKARASTDVWQWLAQVEREINPAATLVPAGTADPGKALATEKAEFKKMMADTNSKYYKGPEAEALQARYREIVEKEEQLKERGRGA